MSRYMLLGFTALVLSACDASTTAPPPTPPLAGPGPAASPHQTVRGIVHALPPDSLGVSAIQLMTADGIPYSLVGPNATAMVANDGMDVLVSGELAADVLYVDTFEIIGGTPDGCSAIAVVEAVPNCLIRVDNLRRARRGR